jgi:SAM-dependent methyltransferase
MRPWLRVPLDWRRPATPREYALWWCDRDAYGRLWPELDEQEIAAAYAIPEYFTHSAADEGIRAPAPRSLARRLLEHLAWRCDRSEELTAEAVHARFGPGPLTICELGCGNGSLLSGLQGFGHRTIGVEPDPAARAAAAASGVLALAGTAEALPDGLPRGGCDVVIAKHVLEHCRDPLRALAAMRELVAPGGVLLCEVPNSAATGGSRMQSAWYWLDVPRHMHFFTPRSLIAHCERAGWRVDRSCYDGYCRQFGADWSDAEATILRRFDAAGARPVVRSGTWGLLLATALASPQRKYDSVRVEARCK